MSRYADRASERERESETEGGEREGEREMKGRGKERKTVIERKEEIKNTSHMLVYNNNTNTQYTHSIALYKPIELKRSLSFLYSTQFYY